MNPITYAMFICLSAVKKTPSDVLDGFDKKYGDDPHCHYDRKEFEYYIDTTDAKPYISKQEVAEMLALYRSKTGLAGKFWHESKAEELGLTDIN